MSLNVKADYRKEMEKWASYSQAVILQPGIMERLRTCCWNTRMCTPTLYSPCSPWMSDNLRFSFCLSLGNKSVDPAQGHLTKSRSHRLWNVDVWHKHQNKLSCNIASTHWQTGRSPLYCFEFFFDYQTTLLLVHYKLMFFVVIVVGFFFAVVFIFGDFYHLALAEVYCRHLLSSVKRSNLVNVNI